MTHIHVIHENAAWLEPLAAAFDRQGLPWRDWFLECGIFDLSRPPPKGVFYNRMSASSHTRGHRYAAELTASVLAWLERHGRRVVNGSHALDLEISKARQYAALEAAGIRTPDTVLVAGTELLIEAARRHFADGRFILKPNRGGKGLGVRLFRSADALADYLNSPDYEPPVDGLHLLQQYVEAPEPLITRAEFVGGRFMYAVEVDTSDGFELCPADACAVDDAFCPAGPDAAPTRPRAKFTIIDGIDPALKRPLRSLSRRQRHRCRRDRVHHRRRGRRLHLRRQHQHQLQPRRRGPRRPFRHGHARPLPRHRTRQLGFVVKLYPLTKKLPPTLPLYRAGSSSREDSATAASVTRDHGSLVETVYPRSIAAGDLGLLLFSTVLQNLLDDLPAPGEGGFDMGII